MSLGSLRTTGRRTALADRARTAPTSPPGVAVAEDVADLATRDRTLARVRTEAVTEERRRIARELHDCVAQPLYSACMITEALAPTFDSDATAGHRAVAELRDLILATLAELRTLTLGLRPAGIESASLARLIHERADAFTGRFRVPVDVLISGEPAVSSEVRFAVYRVLGELLANVARHAEASHVAVHLSRARDGGGLLEVFDNGRGFDPDMVANDHHGLGIAREQLAPVGGNLVITSGRGRGVRAVVTWPGEQDDMRDARAHGRMVEAKGAA